MLGDEPTTYEKNHQLAIFIRYAIVEERFLGLDPLCGLMGKAYENASDISGRYNRVKTLAMGYKELELILLIAVRLH